MDLSIRLYNALSDSHNNDKMRPLDEYNIVETSLHLFAQKSITLPFGIVNLGDFWFFPHFFINAFVKMRQAAWRNLTKWLTFIVYFLLFAFNCGSFGAFSVFNLRLIYYGLKLNRPHGAGRSFVGLYFIAYHFHSSNVQIECANERRISCGSARTVSFCTIIKMSRTWIAMNSSIGKRFPCEISVLSLHRVIHCVQLKWRTCTDYLMFISCQNEKCSILSD